MIIAALNRVQEEHGWVSAEDARGVAARLGVPLHRVEGVLSFYPHFRRTAPARLAIEICRDMSCWLRGGATLCAGARSLANPGEVEIHETSCLGLCDGAPAAMVNGVPLPDASAERLAAIARGDEPVPERAPLPTPSPWRLGADLPEPPAFDPAAVIAMLKEAGLRGLGGAGFPTGQKWELVRNAPGEKKYVVCNADESEPGTFKDRLVMEELPDLVIEGAQLAARVVSAAKVIIYLRHEYERAGRSLRAAISRSSAVGACPLEIFVSPGGYIMGEETALLEALEDRRGEPRNKPPFPGTHGLFGMPTVINNVETLAAAAVIWRRGAEWWKQQGVRGASGLKMISVSGHVARPGVYEIAMGTTVAELIEMAGGCTGELLAFAPGGASSAFLPADKVNTPIDFGTLQAAGSMLGSGALVVVAKGTDLLALATNVVRFFRNESCGKCVPCRVGSEKAVAILEDVLAGKRDRSALGVLGDLEETMRLTSICGLGQVALVPILSVTKNFPADEERR